LINGAVVGDSQLLEQGVGNLEQDTNRLCFFVKYSRAAMDCPSDSRWKCGKKQGFLLSKAGFSGYVKKNRKKRSIRLVSLLHLLTFAVRKNRKKLL
jgi:hypothetical protein